jgi:hypothetical protein
VNGSRGAQRHGRFEEAAIGSKPASQTVDSETVLPGADFADSYRLVIDEALTAPVAARRMMTRRLPVISALLALRNLAVRPFGLKTGGGPGEKVGIFPVLSETPERVVLGFDDAHLDFRIVVESEPHGEGAVVTATTLIRRNNRLGRVYLALVLPFHRVIVPAMLRQVARP